MATSAKPSDVAATVTVGSPRYLHEIERALQKGIKQGRDETRVELLTFLQEKFMATEDTRTPESRAILKVVKETSEFLRQK